MSNNCRAEFPRPDFRRKDWLCLNGEWEFQFDWNGEDVYKRQAGDLADIWIIGSQLYGYAVVFPTADFHGSPAAGL